MRITVSILAAAFAGLASSAASACPTAPVPIAVTVWEHAPSPEQVYPGEVALEVSLPVNARFMEPTDPNQIITTSCNPDQRTLFQIVRVLAGDARGQEFVILPGWMIVVVAIDPATGKPLGPVGPQSWFVVGTLQAQSKYAVVVDDPAVAGNAAGSPGENVPPTGVGRGLLALNPRSPPQ